MFKSVTKIFIAIFLIVSSMAVLRIAGTNAFFTDNATVSGNTFSAGYWVVPKIDFSSPTLSENWQALSSQTIQWAITTSDPSASITSLVLEYKCGSGSYSPIQTFSNNPGHYEWTVPNDISDSCKIKATATDSHSLIGSGESDGFKISSTVVLNEFVPNPSGNDNDPMPGGEWVELYNKGSLTIDVNGWYLYNSSDSHSLKISSSNTFGGTTTIASHKFLVVYRNEDNNFELNDTHDTLRLFDKSIASGGKLLDSFSYIVNPTSGDTDPIVTMSAPNVIAGDIPEDAPGKSWARFPDGTGAWFDPIPTPGEKNTKSLDLEKFQKYYSDRCIKDEKAVSVKKDPVCDVEFLTWLGILDAKKNVVQEKDNTVANDAPIAPGDAVVAPGDNPAPADPAPADPPKIIEKVIVPDPKPEVIVKEPEVVKVPDPPKEDTPVEAGV